MTREKREWHPNFIKYMKFIANHPNYRGMPDLYKENGTIRWVVTGKSEIGKRRTKWWESKADELGISRTGKWIAKVAKENHPTKKKVCQTCGREMSINYVYPTKQLIKKLNKIPSMEGFFQYEDFNSIDEILHEIISALGMQGLDKIAKIFGIPKSVKRTESAFWRHIKENFVGPESRKMSPGAMSNAPDRLDGFHTYNLCCRAVQNTGRHAENLARYIEDRRAYEHWAGGDWKAASWLMQGGDGDCVICGTHGPITADHIGPISLGFAHRPKFQPTCRSCNSAKNNRMFLHDVKILIEDEKKGEHVVSWHSKHIWDRLKNRVATDDNAKKLSSIMRKNHHQFIELFYKISIRGYKDFLLQYLNPNYAYYSIEFKDLDPATFHYKGMVKKPGDITQYRNNAARYVRIALESLEEYHNKINRKVKLIETPEINQVFSQILEELREDTNFNQEARTILNEAFEETDKREREEKIKLALQSLEKEPSRNQRAEMLINKSMQIVAKILEVEWK